MKIRGLELGTALLLVGSALGGAGGRGGSHIITVRVAEQCKKVCRSVLATGQ